MSDEKIKSNIVEKEIILDLNYGLNAQQVVFANCVESNSTFALNVNNLEVEILEIQQGMFGVPSSCKIKISSQNFNVLGKR